MNDLTLPVVAPAGGLGGAVAEIRTSFDLVVIRLRLGIVAYVRWGHGELCIIVRRPDGDGPDVRRRVAAPAGLAERSERDRIAVLVRSGLTYVAEHRALRGRDRVIAHVISGIAAGRLKPGQPVLAEQLGCETNVATPRVEEAIIVLCGWGVLVSADDVDDDALTVLRAAIDEGRLAPHVLLPTRAALREEHDISWKTARQLGPQLVEHGYAYPIAGGLFRIADRHHDQDAAAAAATAMKTALIRHGSPLCGLVLSVEGLGAGALRLKFVVPGIEVVAVFDDVVTDGCRTLRLDAEGTMLGRQLGHREQSIHLIGGLPEPATAYAVADATLNAVLDTYRSATEVAMQLLAHDERQRRAGRDPALHASDLVGAYRPKLRVLRDLIDAGLVERLGRDPSAPRYVVTSRWRSLPK